MRKNKHSEITVHTFEPDEPRDHSLGRSAKTTLLRIEGRTEGSTLWCPDPLLTFAPNVVLVLFSLTFITLLLTIFTDSPGAQLPPVGSIIAESAVMLILSALTVVFPKGMGRPSVIRADADGIEVSDGVGIARVPWDDIERADMGLASATLRTRSRTEILLSLGCHPWANRRALRETVARAAGLSSVPCSPGFVWSYSRIECSV